jgi:hypothetical protein
VVVPAAAAASAALLFVNDAFHDFNNILYSELIYYPEHNWPKYSLYNVVNTAISSKFVDFFQYNIDANPFEHIQCFYYTLHNFNTATLS